LDPALVGGGRLNGGDFESLTLKKRKGQQEQTLPHPLIVLFADEQIHRHIPTHGAARVPHGEKALNAAALPGSSLL
jgi:hypothetical protein